MVCATQLYALGLSKDQVSDRVRIGWLHRLYRGVYAVGHRRLTIQGQWMAATLAAGKRAVLSHESAASLWGIRAFGSGMLHVTIPEGSGRARRPGLVIHRIATLRVGERIRHLGIPVTTTARTILDLAGFLPRRGLERAIDEADRLRLCGGQDLEEIVELHSGQAGAGALRRVLDSHSVGSTVTRSELEERFLALCRKYRLPQPELNVVLLDFVIDFLWRDARLVVEVDGHASHGTRRAFQSDRDRDGRLAVSGYRVLRFTWWDVTRRPGLVADRVRRMLQPR